MRQILSFLFDRLTDPLGLPIHPFWEYLILLAIGGIAYLVAYSFVGDLYNNGSIQLGCTGSIIHWIIRFTVFLIIWAVTYFIIWLVRAISAHWVLILCILGGIVLLCGITFATRVISAIVKCHIEYKAQEEKEER